jgi:methylmalonyl-CoA/ethylmalonyl-CoA epimerase
LIQRIDHIGIAVRSLAEAVKFYETTLGLKCEKQEEVKSQMVRTAFFRVGETNLELLEPTSAESPLTKFLETHGEGIHHLAFRSDDIDGDLGHAANSGCRLVNSVPFEGAEGKRVAFLHPKSTFGVLMEFCSPKAGG